MEPQVWADEEGDELVFAPSGEAPGRLRLHARRGVGVYVTAADIPVIAGKAYRALGLPSPVILERPEVPQDGSPFRFGDFGLTMRNGSVAVSLPGVEGEAITPAALRKAAAYLAAYADMAVAQPDPAEVEELAKAIRADRATHDALPLPPEIDKLSARAALRWMNAKAARDDA
jgi:hypothetical protein